MNYLILASLLSAFSVLGAVAGNPGRNITGTADTAGLKPAGNPSRSVPPQGPARSPNVVFIFSDQWRASATGYSGDPNVKTPNLDRLAREGINFGTAVSVCPVCTPYRAALLTGRYPTRTGMFMNDLYLPDKELCMGEIFKAGGYETGYIGKWHLDGHGRSTYIPPERRQGFDYWKVAECDHTYPKSHYYTGNSEEKKFWDGYDAFAQTKDAGQYIRDHAKGEKPFLLVVSYGTPHFPHDTAPKDYKDLYPPAQLKTAPNVPDSMKARVRHEAQGYYAHCTALDKCVGDLVQVLDQAGIADNTILVFTSDHGEMMGAHGISPSVKQHPWDESIRVPFLLRYPAAHGKSGKKVKMPIDTPDILPTLLSLAGIKIPATIEGEDLSQAVTGPEHDRAALIMSVSPFARGLKEYRGIRTGRYTYVRNLQGPWLMFDNETDPYQLKNLANNPEQAALQKQLEEQLQAELKKIGDEFKPGSHYLGKWGYKIGNDGSIPFNGSAAVQGPGMGENASP